MRRVRALRWGAGILLGAALIVEFGSCLRMSLSGDDFELFALARIGGFSPLAIVVPHRGVFLKPIMNLVWASLARLFGARASLWYAVGLTVHILNAALFGLFANRLAGVFTREGRTTPSDHRQSPSSVRLRIHDPRDFAFGFVAALIWATHDRLAEPLYSISSLNHSLTFTLYLAALLVWLGRASSSRVDHAANAPGDGGSLRSSSTIDLRKDILAGFVLLLPLFSYEVGMSVIGAAALVLWQVAEPAAPAKSGSSGPSSLVSTDGNVIEGRPSGVMRVSTSDEAPVRRVLGLLALFRLRLAAVLAGTALLYVIVQVCVRASAGAGGYYRPSLLLALENCGEAALAFLHIAAGAIPSRALTGLGAAAVLVLAGGLTLARDRVIRFGAGWSLAALLPIALIPELSDRYHYIVFAGLALIAARVLARTWRPIAVRPHLRVAGIAAALGLGVHIVLGFAGSIEQARYYRFKAALPASLLQSAGAMLDASASNGPPPGLIVVAWPDEPDFMARRIAAYDAARGGRWVGETSHPVYVRPAAILGSVYPADLVNTAGASRGLYVRAAPPTAAARSIREGRFRVMPFVPGPISPGAPAGPASWVASELRRQLDGGQLPLTVQPPAMSPLRLAYLETTDRAGAFDAEYRAP